MTVPTCQAELVAARVAVVLANATAAGARVFSDREEAFERDESPSILVELVNEDTSPHAGGRQGVDLTVCGFAVIVLTRGANWRTTVNTVRAQAHAVLMADSELNGLLANLHRGRAEWRSASADLPLGYCAQQYSGKYLSNTSALSR